MCMINIITLRQNSVSSKSNIRLYDDIITPVCCRSLKLYISLYTIIGLTQTFFRFQYLPYLRFSPTPDAQRSQGSSPAELTITVYIILPSVTTLMESDPDIMNHMWYCRIYFTWSHFKRQDLKTHNPSMNIRYVMSFVPSKYDLCVTWAKADHKKLSHFC